MPSLPVHDQSSRPNGNVKGQLLPVAQTVPAVPDLYGYVSGYPGGVADGPELFGFNLLEIWRLLNKRKWIILGIAAAVLALGAVRTLMKTPIYTAAVRLQIDPQSEAGQIRELLAVEGHREIDSKSCIA